MKHICLALDLKNDPQLISEYVKYHKNVWPEILESIHKAGVLNMQIYNAGNRLFLTMAVSEDFSFEAKSLSDQQNEKVQQWETLMWNYQQALPFSKPNEKWVIMDKIFELNSEQ